MYLQQRHLIPALTNPRFYPLEIEEYPLPVEKIWARATLPSIGLTFSVPYPFGLVYPDGSEPSLLWELEHASFSPIRQLHSTQRGLPAGEWPVPGKRYLMVPLDESGWPEGHNCVVHIDDERLAPIVSLFDELAVYTLNLDLGDRRYHMDPLLCALNIYAEAITQATARFAQKIAACDPRPPSTIP